MERLKGIGHAVGEYKGDGQGETEDLDMCQSLPDAEPDVDDNPEEENEDSSDDAHPLSFFYDCETTGFSIYDEHVVEVAAKVVGVPLSSVSSPTFSSLIHTPRNIPKMGKCY